LQKRTNRRFDLWITRACAYFVCCYNPFNVSNREKKHLRVDSPVFLFCFQLKAPMRAFNFSGQHIYERNPTTQTVANTRRSFGAPLSVSGEVSVCYRYVGYPEALTDPSFRGQSS